MRNIVAIVIFSFVGFTCAGGGAVNPGEVEICDDGLDNDGDGYFDCADNDCGQTAICQSPEHESRCDDGLDNDNDGTTDCADPDCTIYPVCQTAAELCTDAMDNDGDNLTDCDDPDCATHTFCLSPEVLCDDGQDNDNDGQTDCDDADCNGDPACAAQQEICDDNTDNDGDTLVDCDDPNCVNDPACQVDEDCDDGLDNDGDTLVDCDDPDCVADPACTGPTTETDCDDGVDNDNDGHLDCLDPDCVADPACTGPTTETDCDDGVDNDNDGHLDCADTDCSSTPPCDRCYDTFADLPSTHWSYDYVRALYVHEIVDGCLTNPLSYCPDDIQQRKYFAIMLIRAMGETVSSAAMNAYFSDLTDAFTAPYVNRLWELGITTGCGSGQFCPDIAVTRQDTAIFLIRALNESQSSAADDAYFSDLAGSYAIGYINRLYELNISDGCGGNNYCPLDDMLRAAGATFIARAFNYTDAFCGF